METLQKERNSSMCAYTKKERNGPATANLKAFLQPAKTATMCTACLEYARPPPPIPSFLLAQKLYLKQIVSTDNMRPKLHDEYTHHQWLKETSENYQCKSFRSTCKEEGRALARRENIIRSLQYINRTHTFHMYTCNGRPIYV